MMQTIEKVGFGAVLWIVAVFVYSASVAYAGEAETVGWFMSFGNSVINLMILWVGIEMLKTNRVRDSTLMNLSKEIDTLAEEIHLLRSARDNG